jgi:hypothetical protein
MFPRFKKTVEKIIEIYSNGTLNEFYLKDSVHFKIEKPNFQNFTVEKQGSILMIGYYRVLNGDLISDPIFVFTIGGDNQWYPIRIEQILGEQPIGMFKDGGYQYYPRSFKEVKSFATTCASEWKSYYL